jgi:hypothetical protein
VEAALVRVLKAELPDLVEVNSVAVDVAREQAADLLVGASKTKKKVVRSLIRRSLDQGWSDAVLRARLAEVVGLDPRSAQALQNLEAGKIPPGRRERMVAAYRRRLLKHRARVVASTETQRALMDAQRRLWVMMRERGDVSAYAVRVTVTHKDDALCAQCRSEGGVRRSLKHREGGPPFHPLCRCYEVLVDEGIVKMVGPEGGSLYVPSPLKGVSTGYAHPYNPKCACSRCKKKRRKRKADGSMDAMDVSKGRLNWSPKENWVDKVGGLPKYIEDIALALMRDHGYPRERAIPIAISRVKMWAKGGGDVNPDTRAKAAKAVAEWTAKRAKAKGDN